MVQSGRFAGEIPPTIAGPTNRPGPDQLAAHPSASLYPAFPFCLPRRHLYTPDRRRVHDTFVRRTLVQLQWPSTQPALDVEPTGVLRPAQPVPWGGRGRSGHVSSRLRVHNLLSSRPSGRFPGFCGRQAPCTRWCPWPHHALSGGSGCRTARWSTACCGSGHPRRRWCGTGMMRCKGRRSSWTRRRRRTGSRHL